jgi:hypothetical protein
MTNKAKQIYESFMRKLICPSYYQTFSLENIEWLKLQVRDNRISDTVLRAEIRLTIAQIEDELANEIPKG